LTVPSQVGVVRKHVEGALAAGGTAVVGGVDSVRPPYIWPVVIVVAAEDCDAVREETFGPTITVRTVADEDEAVRLANASRYGLGSSVYSRRRGLELARRLRAGATAVNGVITYATIPGLPFGGYGESGDGRVHGRIGLQAFAQPKAITHRRFNRPMELAAFARDPRHVDLLRRMVKLRYGRYS
jgi:acyl-CoA reductase-like NAD-dependent aldehyde dehydrogenase